MPWAIANASYKQQKRNEGVTEIVEIQGRGHSLVIDNGWREVADTASSSSSASCRRRVTRRQSGMADTGETPWPELPWRDWQPTLSTVHMWLQIVGKVRMALAPPRNHWWHATLYVTARGLTTSVIPYAAPRVPGRPRFHRAPVADHRHRRSSFDDGLEPRSVAQFYRDFMDGLRGLGIEVRIWPSPLRWRTPSPSRPTISMPRTTAATPGRCGAGSSRPTG